jgi:hypothetical protein
MFHKVFLLSALLSTATVFGFSPAVLRTASSSSVFKVL